MQQKLVTYYNVHSWIFFREIAGLFLVFLFFSAPLLQASESRRLVDLRGHWRFEIGDDMAWAEPEFDDSQWETIFVPATWEDEGFPGYDGYAWYRKHFQLSEENNGSAIFLHLGRIDDVDETYVNGHLIGYTGSFPPKYHTAYNKHRKYVIPPEYLNFSGENVIAVRVYDDPLEGGIVDGKIGIYQEEGDLTVAVGLSGIWKFMPGDEIDWSHREFDDSEWYDIMVPAYWEVQGFKDVNGFAWYRKKVVVPEKYRGEKLVLILGKIDDLDETFFNGERIGRTGKFYLFSEPKVSGFEWQEIRSYFIPEEHIRFGEENTIAVRVFDGMIDGGMFEGPLGIVTREQFLKWEEFRDDPENFWKHFDNFFKK